MDNIVEKSINKELELLDGYIELKEQKIEKLMNEVERYKKRRQSLLAARQTIKQ